MSPYMRAHTYRGPWWDNPPRTRASSGRGRARARQRPARAPKRSAALHVTRLGRAVELRYVHGGNGKAHKHRFGRGVAVAYTRDRRYLVVGPLNVNPYIEG